MKHLLSFETVQKRLNMAKNNFSISKTFDWYLIDVMPVVEKYTLQPNYGEHGLYTHTAAVVFRGIDFAIDRSKNPISVALACAFHDMARINNKEDPNHGPNAVPLAIKAMNEIDGINNNMRDFITYAVKYHDSDLIPPNYIAAFSWAADRVRRAWYGGYHPKYFATPRAHYVASHVAADYLEFMRRNISEYARKIIELSEYY